MCNLDAVKGSVLAFLGVLGCSSSETSQRLFTTASEFDGNLGGLAGADQKCNQAAAAANLGGTWRAWLSDSTTNAIDRIEGAGPWARLDGMVVFNNRANLTTLPLVPLQVNENGANIGDGLAWTGTTTAGTASPQRCNEWTSADPGVQGDTGQTQYTDAQWTEGQTRLCGGPGAFQWRLFCFEQP
jgi:hypothetical protein